MNAKKRNKRNERNKRYKRNGIMNENLSWNEFDDGLSIGQTGAEGGEIIRDEEHSNGARITLEQDCLAPFAITCTIYGWFVHTRFFENEDEAENQFAEMQSEIDEILTQLPDEETASHEEMEEAGFLIEDFVERYP